jgi:hypothetical protein
MPVNLCSVRKSIKEPVKASVKPVPTRKGFLKGVHENKVLGLAKYINALGTGKTTAQNHVVLLGTTKPHYNSPR